ncbi:MAG: chromate transporter [Bacteroidales bacterium]|jgi:chromate transporter|nr:chromate transporter [Bacteroidales bacterium]
MIYLKIFYLFFKIGLWGFGGGVAMYSMIQFEVVEHYGWLTASEFADIVAISQMTPGPVSINCATYVGYQTGHGIFGAVLASFALCLPSILLMWVVLHFLFKHKENQYVKHVLAILKPTIAGLILAAGALFINSDTFIDWETVLIAIASFAALYFADINPIIILGASALIGIAIYG